MTTHYLSCDLGADSGRIMLATLDKNKLSLEELHRFPNVPIKSEGALLWDIPRLIEEMKNGLKKAAQRKLHIESFSCDSWGVDYVLLDKQGSIIPPTYHYRDARCQKGVEITKSKIDWPTIFDETGIQFMPLNTIYQLATESQGRFARTEQLLLIGDAFNYFLCGVGRAEESLASTTQVYNPRTKSWSKRILDALQIPARIMPAIVPSGTKLGTILPRMAQETGLSGMQIIASCSHDTGAAVAAVPGVGKNWAYLSSGTWSLIGVELDKPIINETCRELNVTNEIGFGSTVRLLKNIIGLWLVQESRREWAKDGKNYDFATLEKLASEAKPFVSLINPADGRFLAPDNMPSKIISVCKETGQTEPWDHGALIRCVYESLALLYRKTLRKIEQITGEKIECLHVVGGGSKDALLNQFTANALQIPVLAGPVEATALGNILVQSIATGRLASLAEGRQVIRNSVQPKEFKPQNAAEWDEAYQRFEKLFPA